MQVFDKVVITGNASPTCLLKNGFASTIHTLDYGMNALAIIILAAGKSSRMRGKDKLTQSVGGEPQIRRIVQAACETSPIVFITLPDVAHPRASLLLGLKVQIVPVPEAHLGMGRSIAAAISALKDPLIKGAMIVPADMPELTQLDLQTIGQAFISKPSAIIQATTPTGSIGHPVVFPRSTFEQLKSLSGDQGARDVISANAQLRRTVSLPNLHAKTDLDTPEEWREWLSSFNRNPKF